MTPITRILILTVLNTHWSSAFAPHLMDVKNGHINIYTDRRKCVNKSVLAASEKEDAETDDDLNIDVLSSLQLPSPEVVKDNILEGKFGERGETYVVAQFSLLFFIALGLGDFLSTFLGPAFIVAGLILVYKSAADLKDNLSPWPVATDPKNGRGSLINEGIYNYVRHPMYAGLLMGMTGLSIWTDSTTRLLLTIALYLVLDAKSDFEEKSLVEMYGSKYDEYKAKVSSKFFPLDVKGILTKM